jgi:protein-tyrosine-phosphatase
MAEVFFIQYLKEKGYDPEKWKVMSAGCWAYPDLPATRHAVQTAEKMSCDLFFHSSKAVSENLLKNFNLILCMESDHVNFIKRNFPEAADNVYLFSEMIGDIFEIDDPVGETLKEYEHTAKKLKEIMHRGFKKIRGFSQK